MHIYQNIRNLFIKICYIYGCILAFMIIYIHGDVYAQYQDDYLVRQLRYSRMDIDGLIQKNKVTRYEVAKLLNYTDCRDCMMASDDFASKYTLVWLSNLKKSIGRNFADIKYDTKINTGNYYYCLAYVADKSYVNGYGFQSDFACQGKYCGDRYINGAETIQILYNISSQNFISQDISINTTQWGSIRNRALSQTVTKLNINDYVNIKNALKKCGKKTCKIDNKTSLDTYMTYCQHNLKACGMKEFVGIRQGQRPIAQLNYLINNGIISQNDLSQIDIHKYMSGKNLLRYLSRINNKVNCSFDNDYDSDGILNYKDNCPNDYNPDQKPICQNTNPFYKDNIGAPPANIDINKLKSFINNTNNGSNLDGNGNNPSNGNSNGSGKGLSTNGINKYPIYPDNRGSSSGNSGINSIYIKTSGYIYNPTDNNQPFGKDNGLSIDTNNYKYLYELKKGDTIRAVLMDSGGLVEYNYSAPYVVR